MLKHVDNIEYWTRSEGDTFKVIVPGSGKFLSPWQKNDWFRTNFALCRVAGVHFGYLVAATKIFRAEHTEWSKYKYIVIQGHSLGGAVATVLGALVSKLLPTTVSVTSHNYGGPAAFGRWPAEWRLWTLKLKAHWYTTSWDVVPWLIFWNVHVGRWHRRITKWRNPIKAHIEGYPEWRK